MRRSLVVVAALSWIGAGCFSSGPGDSRVIRAKGEYEHPAGITLPARTGPLERKLIREFGGDPGNLAAYYASAEHLEPVQAHVYLAPAGQAFTGRLKQQFVQRMADMRRGRSKLVLRETRVVRAPGGTGRAVGYEATYRSGSGERELRSLLRVFQCGQWFLRIQATAREKDVPLLDISVGEIHAAISCEEMAAHGPAGASPEVSLEPGVADRGDWLAYAQGQVDWLRRNASAGSLAQGIPDHDLELFVAAWKRALDVRGAQSAPAPDPLFELLARARQSGFLEELVWSEHLGFLTPPPELDLESFRAWRSGQPTAPYQIRAGAVLSRSAPETRQ
jgi:hypothetical protein